MARRRRCQRLATSASATIAPAAIRISEPLPSAKLRAWPEKRTAKLTIGSSATVAQCASHRGSWASSSPLLAFVTGPSRLCQPQRHRPRPHHFYLGRRAGRTRTARAQTQRLSRRECDLQIDVVRTDAISTAELQPR